MYAFTRVTALSVFIFLSLVTALAEASHAPHHSSSYPFQALENGVEIRPSTLPEAGKGLFAKKNFQPGDTIAIYFGETLPYELKTYLKCGSSAYIQNYGNDSNLMILGDVNPPAPHLSAQLANDPYVTADDIKQFLEVDCTDLRPESLVFFKDFTKRYAKSLLDEKPSFYLRPLERSLAFVAASQISAGEEILYPYSASYWWMISVSICSRKGLLQKANAIQRAASEAWEEIIAAATNPEDAKNYEELLEFEGSYIASEDSEIRTKANHRFELETRLMSLVAPADLLNLALFRDGDDVCRTKTRARILEEFGLREKLLEISRMPNSEFYDDRSYGKIHPRSKQLFMDLIAFIKARLPDHSGWFVDVQNRKLLPWDDLLRMILSADE